jgi:hypothetical protein
MKPKASSKNDFEFNDFDFNLPVTVYNIKDGRNANWDWNVALDVSKEEGFEMGWDKGMEIAAGKIARAMKEKGADVNFIADVTNLPIDTIQSL